MTFTQSPVGEAERRAWSYWFIDGLPNLIAGLLCLLVSTAWVVATHYRNTHSPLVITLVVVSLGIYFVILIRFRTTLQWLKSRITYRRTGYTAPPYFTENSTPPSDLTMLNLSGVREKETLTDYLRNEDTRRRVWLILGFFAIAALVGVFVPSPIFCTAAGLAVGAVTWLVTRQDQRMMWTVVFWLPFSLVYTLNGSIFPHVERISYFVTGVGFVLALTGGVSLILYLRRNPARRA